jgi:hypothetical protein
MRQIPSTSDNRGNGKVLLLQVQLDTRMLVQRRLGSYGAKLGGGLATILIGDIAADASSRRHGLKLSEVGILERVGVRLRLLC